MTRGEAVRARECACKAFFETQLYASHAHLDGVEAHALADALYDLARTAYGWARAQVARAETREVN